MRVKLTRFVRSVGYLHRTRREGQHKNATPKTANRPVFCFVSTRCLVYYFLLFLDPNLTISYLATLAGLLRYITSAGICHLATYDSMLCSSCCHISLAKFIFVFSPYASGNISEPELCISFTELRRHHRHFSSAVQ